LVLDAASGTPRPHVSHRRSNYGLLSIGQSVCLSDSGDKPSTSKANFPCVDDSDDSLSTSENDEQESASTASRRVRCDSIDKSAKSKQNSSQHCGSIANMSASEDDEQESASTASRRVRCDSIDKSAKSKQRSSQHSGSIANVSASDDDQHNQPPGEIFVLNLKFLGTLFIPSAGGFNTINTGGVFPLIMRRSIQFPMLLFVPQNALKPANPCICDLKKFFHGVIPRNSVIKGRGWKKGRKKMRDRSEGKKGRVR
jgi:hypothetical protein